MPLTLAVSDDTGNLCPVCFLALLLLGPLNRAGLHSLTKLCGAIEGAIPPETWAFAGSFGHDGSLGGW